MISTKERMEPIKKDLPLYTISVAAHLLDLHPRTLRIYEEEGLVNPQRRGTRRLYSANDLQWVRCLRSLIHDEGISIPGIKKLLRNATCYQIADCPEEICSRCEAVVDQVIPHGLHLAGDSASAENNRKKDVERRAEERQRPLQPQPQKKVTTR